MKRLILGSSSPRRQALLSQIGYKFEVVPSDYEEDMTLDMSPADLAIEMGKGKALDVAKKVGPGCIVIGIDTFVVFGDKKLGKPVDEDDAKRILQMIAGQKIEVYSGIAIIDTDTNEIIEEVEISKLKMHDFSKEEINAYIKTKDPLDKAGAFGIHGLGGVFVQEISGCFYNIAGFPVYKITRLLNNLGMNIEKMWEDVEVGKNGIFK